MELGNVYEVFQIGDIVKVKDVASLYCGEIGVIVRIEETGCYTEPIYTIRLDRPDLQSFDNPNRRLEIRINAKSLVKAGHIDHDEESITMGVRNGKNYLTQIASFKNKDNGFDSIIYEMEKKRKFTEGSSNMKKIDVEKIIFNEFKTIVFWNDGTKTIVSMSQEERDFDPEDAFRAAYTKKMYGTNSKIKRIIAEKSNIEQHQRIAKERLKEEMEKISRDYDKYMKENYPWMYRNEEKKPEKQQDEGRPIKFCQCGCGDDISKDRAVEEPAGHKFKVGDGVTISSIRSPYFGRGGKIVKIHPENAGSIPHYTVEFYTPGNPGSSFTYDFCECQLTYDPTRAIDEKTKKMADAWYVFFHEMIDSDDGKEENEDGEK